jgi:hypothetical protein
VSKGADTRDDKQAQKSDYCFGHGGLDLKSNSEILGGLRAFLATPLTGEGNEHLDFQSLLPV